MQVTKIELPTLIIQTAMKNAYTIAVSIKDNGPGVAKDIRKKLFTPYFSTKLNGMGLGLAICRTVIEAHGGQISVSTAKNRGTTFCFTLPILKEEESHES